MSGRRKRRADQALKVEDVAPQAEPATRSHGDEPEPEPKDGSESFKVETGVGPPTVSFWLIQLFLPEEPCYHWHWEPRCRCAQLEPPVAVLRYPGATVVVRVDASSSRHLRLRQAEVLVLNPSPKHSDRL